MTTTLIIIFIILLLLALTGYALINQAITTRREQRLRLIAALKARLQDFKYLATAFPPNVLTKDLNVLVHRCIVDVLQQLIKLDPNHATWVDELTEQTALLEQAMARPRQQKRERLNPQQSKEVKRLLRDMFKFIGNLKKRNVISEEEYQTYETQIKDILTQMSVDNYIDLAKQSQANKKPKLAIHYFTLARRLLTKDDSGTNYQKQIRQLNSVIAKLNEQIAKEQSQKSEPQDKQWQNFNEDESWKKKNMYD